MAKQKPTSTYDRLLAKIVAKVKEAEDLVKIANDTTQGEDNRGAAMIRWFIVADEATSLIMQAKEHLNDRQYFNLAEQVEIQFPSTWLKYEENVRRFAQFNGKELFEG